LNVLYVMAGAVVGAPLRYLVGRAVTEAVGTRFPAGTLAVNLTGCFLIGILGTLAIERDALSREARLLLITGVLGSYTTFSAFGFETYDLLRGGDVPRALVNAVGSVVAGVLAVWAGAIVTRFAT